LTHAHEEGTHAVTRSLTGLLAVAVLLLPASLHAWTPVVHLVVTEKAIETLPKGLKPFFKSHRLEMPSLAGEPEEDAPAGEGPLRRFAVDRVMPFPFADLPHREPEFQQKYAERAADVGRLPWLIHEHYAKLVEAFKSGDKQRILAEAETVSDLVTDLRNPLALTENFDGQRTGQHGLWVRFSDRLPAGMANGLKLEPDAAHLIEDPRGHVFSVMVATYVWLDNLLYLDDLARRGAAGFGEVYYQALEQRAGPVLRAQLSAAAGDVGSYWYTAWTAAGRPELK
jgi:hypothetical protein